MPTRTDFCSLSEQALMERADAVLRGQTADQQEIYRLASALKNRSKRFGKLRQLLWVARSPAGQVTNRQTDGPFVRKLCQQHALCTYNDNDLPAYKRFDRAIAILKEEDFRDEADPAAMITQETLGIAGAVCKAQWEAFGQRLYLMWSLALYSRGWQQGTQEGGYTGINAACVPDLIASEAEKSGLGSLEAEHRGDFWKARPLTRELLDHPSCADGAPIDCTSHH